MNQLLRLNTRGARVVHFVESPEDVASQRPSPTRNELAHTIAQERLKILKEQVQALKLAESNSRAFLHKFQMRNSKFNTISSSHNKKHHIALVTLKKPMAKELSSSSESTPPSEVRSRNIPFYSGEPSYLDSSEFK